MHSNETSRREIHERGNNCGISFEHKYNRTCHQSRRATTVFSSVSYRLRNFYQTEWDKVHQTYQEEADKYRLLMEQQVTVHTQWNSDLVSFNLRVCSHWSIVVMCMGFYCHTHMRSHTFFLNSSWKNSWGRFMSTAVASYLIQLICNHRNFCDVKLTVVSGDK